jgi:hypothetical protein
MWYALPPGKKYAQMSSLSILVLQRWVPKGPCDAHVGVHLCLQALCFVCLQLAQPRVKPVSHQLAKHFCSSAPVRLALECPTDPCIATPEGSLNALFVRKESSCIFKPAASFVRYWLLAVVLPLPLSALCMESTCIFAAISRIAPQHAPGAASPSGSSLLLHPKVA